MDLLHWLLFGVLPALAAVLLFVGAGGPRFLPLAIAVAICVPFGMDDGWPDWPWTLDFGHGDARQWLWWCFACAGCVGATYDLRLLPKWLVAPFEVLIVLVLPWLVSSTLRAGWSFEHCVLMLGAAWFVLAGIWWVLRGAAKAQPGMAVPLAGTVVLAADTIVLHAQGARLAWHLAGVAAVALGVSVATTLWRRPFVCGTGGTLCITIAHAGVLWCARRESHLLSAPSVLALLAPLALGLGMSRVFADGRTTGFLVALAVTVALAGAAIAMV
ncbi:MAG TPA: hypothetical protein VFZ65_13220 [Planctomycetota bacterium]|nr:hypothetical protein [Planctomycetota bacterium]